MTIEVNEVTKKVETLKGEIGDIKKESARIMTEAAQNFLEAHREWSEAEKFLSKKTYLDEKQSPHSMFSDMMSKHLIKETTESD